MKKQAMAIGIMALLFLLVIFSYTNGGFSGSHTLPIEEDNVNSIQGTNPGVGDCSTCETENDEYAYPVMRPDYETRSKWIESYNNAPRINITSTIITVTSANKHIFIYTPETDLTNGIYTLSMTVKDDENNSRTDTATYTINAEPKATTPTGEFPWIIVIIAMITAIALILIVLFKTGNLYSGL
jgi:ABC-type cobalt transport system substrate-binding protein